MVLQFFTIDVFFYLIVGLLFFFIIGILPVVGSIQGLAILLPLVYKLDPPQAFALMIGGASGMWLSDAACSILLKIPGSSPTVPLTFDGFQLTRRGLHGYALGAATSATILGGIISGIITYGIMSVLLLLLMFLGPAEITIIIAWGLIASIILLIGKEKIKELLSAIIGLLLSTVGFAETAHIARFTFGFYDLWDGIPLSVFFLAMLGLPEFLGFLVRREEFIVDIKYLTYVGGFRTREFYKKFIEGFKEIFRSIRIFVQAIITGLIFGIIPGVGTTAASLLAYAQSGLLTKRKEKLGEGNVDGVIGPQSAIISCWFGDFIPTISFGIPGSAAKALFLGLFMMKGLMPGPHILKQVDLVNYILLLVVIGVLLGSILIIPLLPVITRIVTIRITSWVPILLGIIFIAVYSDRSSLFDLFLLFILTLLGYSLNKYGFSTPMVAIGFVLGGILEQNVALTYQIYGLSFLYKPTSLILIIILVAVTIVSLRMLRRKQIIAMGEEDD